MKVKIKRYASWFGPYQLMNWLFYPFSKQGEYLDREYPEWHEKLSDWYAYSIMGKAHIWLGEKWMDFWNDRRVKVKLDRWDTWNMDHTLADIVLPMLIQLRDTAHGSPMVDDEDVPHMTKRGLGSNESAQLDLFASDEHDHEVWEHGHTRWQWVLNEMIYAFDCKANKDDVYMRFRDDLDAARKEQDRIANGFRLFGKYYEGLWD